MTLVLNGSTGVSAVDGSASTPAIQGNDTNTGVFFPASDTVGISTNGTERMRVDSSGNLNFTGTAQRITGDMSNATVSNRLMFQSTTVNGNTSVGAIPNGTSTQSALALYDNSSPDNSGQLALISNSGEKSIRAQIAGTGSYLPMTFYTGGSERMRIDTSGNVGIGGSPDTLLTVSSTSLSTNSQMIHVTRPGTADVFFVYAADNYAPNGAAATVKVGSQNSTGRSINAGGTINASGADYAEYMTKNGEFTIAKGDVCGIDANGKLTNKFSEALSFVVKSTDPSYVGGDVWGTKDKIGCEPPNDIPENASDAEKEEHATKSAEFNAALEQARQMVDRIAFAGQVPVNVFGATPGQYIVPFDDSGSIKGLAVSNPTFEQYQRAVGKVIAVDKDGRARIIVKVA